MRSRVPARVTLSPARKGLIAVGAAYLVTLVGLLGFEEWDRAACWVVAAGFGVLAAGLPWMLLALCVDYIADPVAWRRTVVVEGFVTSEGYTVPPHPGDQSYVLHRVYEFTTLRGERRRAGSRAMFPETADGRIRLRYDPRRPGRIWPARVAPRTAAAGSVVAVLMLTAAVFALAGAIGFGMSTWN
ncbi:DUF3592 domain-containing protein [Catenulispora pinisilvae]|uniref:DUF3592 domain-containing protein n=1 Tax=Catenulispora pinisilvae TaxID=2705253 RepID=UPI001890EACA|nr:DUF3592 domain-containing protein [Catenulispora pinisilvae]